MKKGRKGVKGLGLGEGRRIILENTRFLNRVQVSFREKKKIR